MRRALLLLLLPLLLIGPSLLPGQRFLPQAPVGFEPLASEHPEAAERAWLHANLVTSDRLFPVLTDELALRARLARGEWPGWEPKFGLGSPLYAGSIASLAYPPNWLRYALPPDVAGGWCALLSLFLAGLGMWLFLERRELVVGACAVGAVAYQAGGFALWNLHYLMKVDAALWLPWALWAVDGLLASRRRSGPALTLATALALLAGFPQIGMFTAYTAAAYALWRALESGAGLRLGGRALAFIALGITSAGVYLLPMAEASDHALRQPQSIESLAAQAMPGGALLTLVFPDAYGSAQGEAGTEPEGRPHPRGFRQTDQHFFHANALEWNLHAGLVVLLLACLVRARKAAFPLVMVLVALGYAQAWPVVRWLYVLPGLDLGAPSRSISVLWALLPWLAALGLHRLLTGEVRGRGLVLAGLGVVGGGLMLPTGGSSAWADFLAANVGGESLQAAARMGLVLACAGVALAIATRTRRGSWVLVLLIVVEGWVQGHAGLQPRDLGEEPLFPPSAAIEAVREAAGDGRVLRFDASDSGLDDVLVLARPNLLHAYGIADLTPYLVFTNRRVVELFGALDARTRYRTGISRLPARELLAHPVLDLARVTCILARRPLEHPRLELRHAGPEFFVYHRSGSLPAAWGVTRAVTTHTDETALGLIVSGSVALGETVVLAPGTEAGPMDAGQGDPGQGGPPTAGPEVRVLELERPTPDRLDLVVESSAGGWVVMSEAWMPGWKATVNGEDTPVLRVDHVARAVRVPAGRSVVRTKYEPWSLRLGVALTLGSLLAALYLARRPSPI